MGIFRHHLDLLFTEATNNNFINGKDVLCISQQAVHLTLNQVYKLAKNYKNLNISEIQNDFDTTNKIPSWVGTKHEKNTNIQTIFKLLGASKVSVCDASDYESPDFQLDLNYPVAEQYKNKFDVIFDVGTLEHVFDTPTALWNFISMLKVNGVLYIGVPSSNAIDHGFYSFSPGLFYDYFNANGLEVLSCHLREGSPVFYKKIGKLYKYNGIGTEIPILSSAAIEVITIAKKNISIENAVKPTQNVYVDKFTKGGTDSFSLKKRIISFIARSLIIFQNFLPNWVEVIIVKWKNKLGKNNIIFVKKI